MGRQLPHRRHGPPLRRRRAARDASAAELDNLTSQAFSYFPGPADGPVDQLDFAHHVAGAVGALNWLHPFREGNGRTIRAFLTNWSRQQGHHLDFTTWTRKEWARASTAACHHDTEPMRDLVVSHLKRLDPDDLQRTITNWG